MTVLDDTPVVLPVMQPLAASVSLDEGYQPTREVRNVQADLAEALRELRTKRPVLDLRWQYHDGQHPTPWLTERHRLAFGPHFTTDLQDNYCGLGVAATVLRLEVTGFQPRREDVPDEAVAAAAALWDANAMDLEQEELYQAAVAAGEAYIIMWPRDRQQPDGTTQQVTDERTGVQLYDFVVNDARNVYLKLGHNRRDRLWAAKVWRDDRSKRWRATLYYPDEVVRLQTAPRPSDSAFPAKADAFLLDQEDPGGPNDLGTVPVFRFARDRKGRSVIDTMRPGQDKINKLAANKMVAAEFLAWPQRYALIAGEIKDDTLRPRPGAFLTLDPGGEAMDEAGQTTKAPATQVGQFPAADLSNYDDAKREEVQTILTLAMLPRRLQVGEGAAPVSGEAVRADEGPFVAVVEDWQQMLGGTLEDIYEALGLEVKPVWKPAEVSNSLSLAQEVLAYVQAGVPTAVAVAYVANWDEDMMAKLTDELDAASERAAAQNAMAGQLALQAFDQGRPPTEVMDDARLGADPAQE